MRPKPSLLAAGWVYIAALIT